MKTSGAKQPTLRQLHYFCTLCRHHHFNKAAEYCAVSQAAFSIAVNNLENILDAHLIDRTNKQVVFTSLGRQIVEQSNIILQEVEKLKAIADRNTSLFTSSLRLGVIPTIAPFILPTALPRIKAEWPEMKLSIHEDLTVNLHKYLLDGELDLLLLALPFDLKGVENQVLFKDHFKLAYKRNTKIFRPPEYKESLLPNGSILLLKDGHCLRNHALSACDVENADKISPYAVSSIHTLVQMVQNNLGITFIPELAIKANMLKHTTIETLDMPEYSYRQIGIAWRKGSQQAEEFRQFAETCISLAGIESH